MPRWQEVFTKALLRLLHDSLVEMKSYIVMLMEKSLPIFEIKESSLSLNNPPIKSWFNECKIYFQFVREVNNQLFRHDYIIRIYSMFVAR